jgi:hypothetical protein
MRFCSARTLQGYATLCQCEEEKRTTMALGRETEEERNIRKVMNENTEVVENEDKSEDKLKHKKNEKTCYKYK